MRSPLQIAFHGLKHTEAVEEAIREKAAKLEQVYDRITSCHVVVEVPHRHHQHGNHFVVRIDLALPGKQIVVNRESPLHDESRDLNVALRDAFDAARRQLEEFVCRRRGFAKGEPERGEAASPEPPAPVG
jgi:ribosome-associated translation inhibitor RaiA